MNCSLAPLLQQGKAQLLDRVLTRPGAKLAPSPSVAGEKPVAGFSVLYVYDRSTDGKAIQVGARSDCRPDGWLPVQAAVPWEHTLVATFANRTGRDRVLFFREEDAVKTLIKAPDAGEQATQLRAVAGGGADERVLSIEPETAVDFNKQFYLLPILEATTQRFSSNPATQVRVLRVAAVTARDKGAPTPDASEPIHQPDAEVRRNFRAAVVFVVDATKSTQPYIDRIREGLDRVYARIEEAKLQDRVRFGLIGYRDDPKAVPGIEYLTKVFVDPNKVDDRKTFIKLAAGLEASKISSRAVAEDGYAGVNAGINGIDWEGFAARYLVMVTDASSRDPGKLSSTGLNAAALSLMAREKQIAILSLHLLTPEGGKNEHEKGKTEYEELTQFPGHSPLYYPVPGGGVQELGAKVDLLAESLVQQVKQAEEGQNPLAARKPGDKMPTNGGLSADKASSDAEKLAADVAAIGHAMRLAYLGRVTGTTAPSMFEAWIADRDFAAHATPSINVRVLLSKAQLSDLAATVAALLEAYQKSQTDPSTLYAQLRSAALTLSRDPNKIGSASNQNLNKEILGEYLEGLPYTSTVMKVDQEDWMKQSPGEQQALIDGLEVKERLYSRFHDDVTKWLPLAEGAAPEDAVYPVPIEALP